MMNKELFVQLCKMSQQELHDYLVEKLSGYGYQVYNHPLWIYAIHNKTDVLLTAHLDTVHKELVQEVVEKQEAGRTIISSPQGIGGDDRCGVYIILRLLEDGCRQPILFCHDEEIGGVGSTSFCKTDKHIPDVESTMGDIKFMLELDRGNASDAVYYDCDNVDFSTFVEKTIPYRFAHGTFSDISVLAPHFKVAAVNLSCGYYKAHTLNEYVVLEEMEETHLQSKKLIEAAKQENRFEYIERQYRYQDWYDDIFYDDRYTSSEFYGDGDVVVHIEWIEYGQLKMADVLGYTEADAIGNFLMEHPTLSFNDLYVDLF